jgi:hypothetical protein
MAVGRRRIASRKSRPIEINNLFDESRSVRVKKLILFFMTILLSRNFIYARRGYNEPQITCAFGFYYTELPRGDTEMHGGKNLKISGLHGVAQRMHGVHGEKQKIKNSVNLRESPCNYVINSA